MPTRATADPDVVDDEAAQRFELRVGDDVVGIADYRPIPGGLAVTHMEVPHRFEGRGFASRLAEVLLRDASRRRLTVRPVCPFLADYVRRHPEHAAARHPEAAAAPEVARPRPDTEVQP